MVVLVSLELGDEVEGKGLFVPEKKAVSVNIRKINLIFLNFIFKPLLKSPRRFFSVDGLEIFIDDEKD